MLSGWCLVESGISMAHVSKCRVVETFLLQSSLSRPICTKQVHVTKQSFVEMFYCAMQPEPTNLHEAAKQGHLERTRQLLEGGADANAKDARSITPLGIAVGFNRVDVIRELLKSDADVALTDGRGNIPLHYAAGAGSLCFPYPFPHALLLSNVKAPLVKVLLSLSLLYIFPCALSLTICQVTSYVKADEVSCSRLELLLEGSGSLLFAADIMSVCKGASLAIMYI